MAYLNTCCNYIPFNLVVSLSIECNEATSYCYLSNYKYNNADTVIQENQQTVWQLVEIPQNSPPLPLKVQTFGHLTNYCVISKIAFVIFVNILPKWHAILEVANCLTCSIYREP